MARIRARLTFASIVSFTALFVALSGGAYALTLPRNSVGTKQLQANAVTGAKITRGAVVSSDVKDGSLLSKDFGAGQLRPGPKGDTGAPGPQGPGEPAGPSNPNASTLQGKSLSDWQVSKIMDTAGPLPKEATFTSSRGKLLFQISGSAYRTSNVGGLMQVQVEVDDIIVAT